MKFFPNFVMALEMSCPSNTIVHFGNYMRPECKLNLTRFQRRKGG
ncbi:hypothetical protein BOSE127_80027 [Bosea sp. 127]|nr:hypothetical protein BOSE127_80027 [Bosea sp. 127]